MAEDALGLPPIIKRLRAPAAQSLKWCPVASDFYLAQFINRCIREPNCLKRDLTLPQNQRCRASRLAGCDARRIGEPDETFVFILSGPINATIDNGQGLGIIFDDEPRISLTT